MSEAAGRWGCFEGFPEHQRNLKVRALIEVIREFKPWALHARVSVEAFNRILKPHAPPPFRTPYFSLCYSIIFGVARLHQKMASQERIEFIFDDHPGLAAKVTPIFDFVMNDAPDVDSIVAGKPSFKDDKDVLPLQAADMLAWAARRQDEGLAARDFHELLQSITDEDAHYQQAIEEFTLEMVADMWIRERPELAAMTKREWDEMMLRLHRSRAIELWLAGRAK